MRGYYFADRSDSFVREMAIRRSGSIRKDLRRHWIQVLLVWIGCADYGTGKEKLPYLYEWIYRLQLLVNKQRVERLKQELPK